MSERLRFEALLASALRSADPVATLRAAATRAAVGEEFARRAALADADGLRLAALLVAKLRFERLIAGSGAARAEFEADPAGFSATFTRYHRAVAPRSFGPAAEAAAFAAWRAAAPRG